MATDVKDIVQSKRNEVLSLARRYGAKNIRLFGSLAKGQEKDNSDIDLLVEFEPGRSLLDHVALWQDLEDLLKCNVDVVTEKSLHHALREQIMREAVPL